MLFIMFTYTHYGNVISYGYKGKDKATEVLYEHLITFSQLATLCIYFLYV